MSSTLCLCLRNSGYFLPCLVLLSFVAIAGADPKPLTKEEQAKVDKTTDRAVTFLKKSQKETGEFDEGESARNAPGLYSLHGGFTFFSALALLESGVSINDRGILKVADMVRVSEPKLDRTYDVSLTILFLDRLGNPKDKEIIRNLALRLIAAQTYTGGWGYGCPTVSEQNRSDLWKTLLAFQAKDDSQHRTQNGKTQQRPKSLSKKSDSVA